MRKRSPLWKLGAACLTLAIASSPTAAKPAAAAVNPESQQQLWLDYLATPRPREPALRFPFERCFRDAARRHGLPLTLLLAVARGESDFDPMAKSPADAHGLMQILWPQTANHLGITVLEQLYEPCVNIDAGARYLKEMLARYQGNLHLALAAYNYGPGRIAVDAAEIPDGAAWYSAYIYRHLAFVMGDSEPNNALPIHYGDMRKLVVIRFTRPYRAAAFVETLEKRLPELELDWFRRPSGDFVVVMLYKGNAQLANGRRMLETIGFGNL